MVLASKRPGTSSGPLPLVYRATWGFVVGTLTFLVLVLAAAIILVGSCIFGTCQTGESTWSAWFLRLAFHSSFGERCGPFHATNTVSACRQRLFGPLRWPSF